MRGNTSCNKYFKSIGIGALLQTPTGLLTYGTIALYRNQRHITWQKETKRAIKTCSLHCQTKEQGRSQGRSALDQQGPPSVGTTWLCIRNQLDLP